MVATDKRLRLRVLVPWERGKLSTGDRVYLNHGIRQEAPPQSARSLGTRNEENEENEEK
ncbi:MAG: hypothetical protein GDA56_27265 [Hormoscilla sp. GM7CHS1pb]|nr:hypothetical protein [Hormoscilla sp. GM7CHS1pb]